MHAQQHEEASGYWIIVVTYAGMLLAFDHSIRSMHFPPSHSSCDWRSADA